MTAYRLSPKARQDLSEIWNYTEGRWGVAQAETYVRGIQAALEKLAAGSAIGRACDDVRPGYRRLPVQSHVIFYRMSGADVDVSRILHERMDFSRHL